MDIKYNLEIEIVVEPIYWRTVPVINYGVGHRLDKTMSLSNKNTIAFNENLISGSHYIWVEFTNKDYNDCQLEKNLDMAVVIESVTIEGMTLDRFKWAGKYYPDYPLDYPDKKTIIDSATYLGWNGKWILPFTMPIFTWIHRLENLGWLYEP